MLGPILALNRGLYVWAIPTSESCMALQAFQYSWSEEEAPIKYEGSSDFHSTVLYCRNFGSVNQKMAESYLRLPVTGASMAVPEIWDDHKGRQILVLVQEHTMLEKINNGLVRSGFSHSFPEYCSHVTLGKFIHPLGPTERRTWELRYRELWEQVGAPLHWSPELRWSSAL